MVDPLHGNGGVDGHVEFGAGGWGLGFAVEIAALRALADAVETIDLQVGCQRQPALQRVDPLARIVRIGFDFGGCVRDPVRVAFLDLVLVPVVAVIEEIFQALFDRQVGRRLCRVALFEMDKGAEADVLARPVIRCPVLVAPNGISTLGQHARDAWHGPEDFSAFLSGKKFLEAVNGEGVKLGCILHFAREHSGKAFQCSQHAATYVDPGLDELVYPVRTASTMSFCLDPVEEVEENLRAHTVGHKDDFVTRRCVGELDV